MESSWPANYLMQVWIGGTDPESIGLSITWCRWGWALQTQGSSDLSTTWCRHGWVEQTGPNNHLMASSLDLPTLSSSVQLNRLMKWSFGLAYYMWAWHFSFSHCDEFSVCPGPHLKETSHRRKTETSFDDYLLKKQFAWLILWTRTSMPVQPWKAGGRLKNK